MLTRRYSTLTSFTTLTQRVRQLISQRQGVRLRQRHPGSDLVSNLDLRR